MTTLVDDGKVVIEVGLNETASKDRNPNVPYHPDEVVPAGIAAARAGAAVLHFHARRPDGTQDWTGDAIYRAAMDGIGAEVDALAYPSYVNADLSHVWALADDPPVNGPGLELAPFDVVQHVRRMLWNHQEQRLEPLTVLGGDPDRPAYPPELDRFREVGLLPTVAAFELGELRWTMLAARSGVLDQPISVKVFMNDTWLKGPFADVASLDAFLTQLVDDIDAEFMVVPYEMRDRDHTEVLLRAALERGLHIRVGIGDNPGAFPHATNAELVEWAVALASEYDLEPATPTDVRTRMGLPTATPA